MQVLKIVATAVLFLQVINPGAWAAEHPQACLKRGIKLDQYTYTEHYDISLEECCRRCAVDDRCKAFDHLQGSGSCRPKCSIKSTYREQMEENDEKHTSGIVITDSISCPDDRILVCGRLDDINECILCPNLCEPTGTCAKNPFGTYYCNCKEGYRPKFGPPAPTCEDINECEGHSRCINAECVNTIGSFFCVCNPGFEKDSNGICQDVNECARTSACYRGLCKNKFGSHTCTCPAQSPTKEQCFVQLPETAGYQIGNCAAPGDACVINEGDVWELSADGCTLEQLDIDGICLDLTLVTVLVTCSNDGELVFFRGPDDASPIVDPTSIACGLCPDTCSITGDAVLAFDPSTDAVCEPGQCHLRHGATDVEFSALLCDPEDEVEITVSGGATICVDLHSQNPNQLTCTSGSLSVSVAAIAVTDVTAINCADCGCSFQNFLPFTAFSSLDCLTCSSSPTCTVDEGTTFVVDQEGCGVHQEVRIDGTVIGPLVSDLTVSCTGGQLIASDTSGQLATINNYIGCPSDCLLMIPSVDQSLFLFEPEEPECFGDVCVIPHGIPITYPTVNNCQDKVSGANNNNPYSIFASAPVVSTDIGVVADAPCFDFDTGNNLDFVVPGAGAPDDEATNFLICTDGSLIQQTYVDKFGAGGAGTAGGMVTNIGTFSGFCELACGSCQQNHLDDIRVAVVTWGNNADNDYLWSDPQTNAAVTAAINGLSRQGGKTCIAKALQRAKNIIDANANPNSRQRFVIMITDGNDNCGGNVAGKASALHTVADKVWAIGIGGSGLNSMLNTVATSSNEKYRWNSFTKLVQNALDPLAKALCDMIIEDR